MFLQNNLFHFAFINRNDTYFCNTLNFDSYHLLWLKLHSSGYDTVYYIEANGGDFKIMSLGDVGFTLPKTGIIKKATNEPDSKTFISFVKERLNDNNALVISLADFCSAVDISGDSANQSKYNKLKEYLLEEALTKHRGIIVFTVDCGEEKFFRKNEFFKTFFWKIYGKNVYNIEESDSDNLIRGKLNQLYPSGCVYFNDFYPESVNEVLSRIVLEDPEKIKDVYYLDAVSGFVSAMLVNKELASLFDQDFNRITTNNTLYRYLKGDSARTGVILWNKLVQYSKRTDYKNVLSSLVLPSVLQEKTLTDDGPEDSLKDIKELLQRVDFQEVNVKINSYIYLFMLQLEKEESFPDWDTYERLLFVIRFCLQWIKTVNNSKMEEAILNIIHGLQNYIACSENVYQCKKNLEMLKYMSKGDLSSAIYQRKKRETENAEYLLNKYKDVVFVSIMNITINSGNEKIIVKMANDLCSRIDDIRVNENIIRGEEEELANKFEERMNSSPNGANASEILEEIVNQVNDEYYDFVLTESDYALYPNKNV